MTSATAGSLRMFRGVSVGALALGVSVGAHSLAGGNVGARAAFTMAALATGAGLATAGRRFTFTRAFIVLIALQPLLHVVLADSGSHAHHAVAIPTQSDIDMVAAHLVATLLAAATLAALDRFIWQWLREVLPPTSIAVCIAEPRIEAPLGLAPQVWSHVQQIVLISPWRGPPIPTDPYPS